MHSLSFTDFMKLLNRHKLFILGTILLVFMSFIPRDGHGEEYQHIIDQVNTINLSISNVYQSECLDKNKTVLDLLQGENIFCCWVPDRVDCLTNSHMMIRMLLWMYYYIDKDFTPACAGVPVYVPPPAECQDEVEELPDDTSESFMERVVERCNFRLYTAIRDLQRKVEDCAR